MNKLMGYLPKYYIDNVEMKHITDAKLPEVEKLWKDIESVKDNQFILTSDSNRLRLWERLLRIRPDFATQSLEYRKEVVLLRLNLTPPFTYRWLDVLLNDRVGEDNYHIGLNHNNYLLTINLIHDDLGLINELRSFLRQIVPANIILIVKRAEIKEVDKAKIIKVGITKTSNKHISRVLYRDRTIYQEVDKTKIIKVGIIKTANKHSFLTTERNRVLEKEINIKTIPVALLRSLNKHSFIIVERDKTSVKFDINHLGITKTGNKHTSEILKRDIKIKTEVEKVKINNISLLRTLNSHKSINHITEEE